MMMDDWQTEWLAGCDGGWLTVWFILCLVPTGFMCFFHSALEMFVFSVMVFIVYSVTN